ncbi:MAG: hypothetical protein FJ095_04115 [Deltaproteobacteria bacterium]|nr:hypothetical protein [Deltaproteobacteria bacterium]
MSETSFPRGGGGRPQPLPKGASVVLVVVSVGTLLGTIAFLAWLMVG